MSGVRAAQEEARAREVWISSERRRLEKLQAKEADAVERLAREHSQHVRELVETRARQARAVQRSVQVSLSTLEVRSFT